MGKTKKEKKKKKKRKEEKTICFLPDNCHTQKAHIV